jgi:hypothetical protein
VRRNVDVIVAGGSGDIQAAKEASATIPIVMLAGGDAVASGFVASLGRPGGNITGLSTLRPELGGKRLELLKEIVPKLSRVTVLGTSTNPGNAQAIKETELAARAFGVQLLYQDLLVSCLINSLNKHLASDVYDMRGNNHGYWTSDPYFDSQPSGTRNVGTLGTTTQDSASLGATSTYYSGVFERQNQLACS